MSGRDMKVSINRYHPSNTSRRSKAHHSHAASSFDSWDPNSSNVDVSFPNLDEPDLSPARTPSTLTPRHAAEAADLFKGLSPVRADGKPESGNTSRGEYVAGPELSGHEISVSHEVSVSAMEPQHEESHIRYLKNSYSKSTTKRRLSQVKVPDAPEGLILRVITNSFMTLLGPKQWRFTFNLDDIKRAGGTILTLKNQCYEAFEEQYLTDSLFVKKESFINAWPRISGSCVTFENKLFVDVLAQLVPETASAGTIINVELELWPQDEKHASKSWVMYKHGGTFRRWSKRTVSLCNNVLSYGRVGKPTKRRIPICKSTQILDDDTNSTDFLIVLDDTTMFQFKANSLGEKDAFLDEIRLLYSTFIARRVDSDSEEDEEEDSSESIQDTCYTCKKYFSFLLRKHQCNVCLYNFCPEHFVKDAASCEPCRHRQSPLDHAVSPFSKNNIVGAAFAGAKWAKLAKKRRRGKLHSNRLEIDVIGAKGLALPELSGNDKYRLYTVIYFEDREYYTPDVDKAIPTLELVAAKLFHHTNGIFKTGGRIRKEGTFTGADLVDWMTEHHFCESRDHAVDIARELLETKRMYAVNRPEAEFNDNPDLVYSLSNEHVTKAENKLASKALGGLFGKAKKGAQSLLQRIKAKRLQNGGGDVTPSPAKADASPKPELETKTKTETKNADHDLEGTENEQVVWNHKVVIIPNATGHSIHVALFNHDIFLGLAFVPLSALHHAHTYEKWFKLYPRPGCHGVNDTNITGWVKLRLIRWCAKSVYFKPRRRLPVNSTLALKRDLPLKRTRSRLAPSTDFGIDRASQTMTLSAALGLDPPGPDFHVSTKAMNKVLKRWEAIREWYQIDYWHQVWTQVISWQYPIWSFVCMMMAIVCVLYLPGEAVPAIPVFTLIVILWLHQLEYKYSKGLWDALNRSSESYVDVPPAKFAPRFIDLHGERRRVIQVEAVTPAASPLSPLSVSSSRRSRSPEFSRQSSRVETALTIPKHIPEASEDTQPGSLNRIRSGSLPTAMSTDALQVMQQLQTLQVFESRIITICEKLLAIFTWRDQLQSLLFMCAVALMTIVLVCIPFRWLLVTIILYQFSRPSIILFIAKRKGMMTGDHPRRYLGDYVNPMANFFRRAPNPWDLISDERNLPEALHRSSI